MYDIVGIGEVLIDFTPAGKSAKGFPVFEQNPGGSVGNMAAAASRLGSKAAFIGKAGHDLFGAFLKGELEKCGVDSSGLVLSDEYPTTLVFVHLFESGERDFTFFRDHGADAHLEAREVNEAHCQNTRALHFASLTFTTDIAAEATRHAIKLAKAAGALITYDPNWRPLIWRDEAHCLWGLREGIGFADIVKLSEEEMELITEKSDEAGAQALFDRGVKLVLLTMGANGSKVITPEFSAYAAPFKVDAVDTTGAGDACFGAFVHALLQTGSKEPWLLPLPALYKAARFANAAAALCVTKTGGMPAMPLLAEVEALLG